MPLLVSYIVAAKDFGFTDLIIEPCRSPRPVKRIFIERVNGKRFS